MSNRYLNIRDRGDDRSPTVVSVALGDADAAGASSTRELHLHCDRGEMGVGEVWGLPAGDDVTDALAGALRGKDPYRTNRIAAAVEAEFPARDPALVARLVGAVELACLDLQARMAGIPFTDAFGGRVRSGLATATSITTDGDDVDALFAAIEASQRTAVHLCFGAIDAAALAGAAALRRRFGPEFGISIEYLQTPSADAIGRLAPALNGLHLDALVGAVPAGAAQALWPRLNAPLGHRVKSVGEAAGAIGAERCDLLVIDLARFNRPSHLRAVFALCGTFAVDAILDAGACGKVGRAFASHLAAAVRVVRPTFLRSANGPWASL